MARAAKAGRRSRRERVKRIRSTLTYAELVRRLFPRLTGGIRWGLERTQELLASAGHPEQRFPTIHIGGTNGKGSVAATLASIFARAGLRTGLYSSPHLCSFRERVRIDGVPIDEGELVAAALPLWQAIEDSGASFFEATTVIAFNALASARVDVAVIEVGLGGRLDSTNVITPHLAVITNIAFDHADYLGNTLEAIANEKAGIIKSDVPLLTGEKTAGVVDIFRRRAAELGASVLLLDAVETLSVSVGGTRFRVATQHWGDLELGTPLVGPHQARNAALAVRAADLLADRFSIGVDDVRSGVAGVHWPGRAQIEQIRGRTWIFDVAHNEAGVAALVETLRSLDLPRPVSLLVGILGDKEWARMLPPLFAEVDSIVLTVPPTAPAARAWDPAEALQRVPDDRARIVLEFGAALQQAEKSAGQTGSVLVTGSFHTVGDALAMLGLCEVSPDFPLPHNVFSG
jgi:dihydrofolate synthase/folylpolyglutamate synthase